MFFFQFHKLEVAEHPLYGPMKQFVCSDYRSHDSAPRLFFAATAPIRHLFVGCSGDPQKSYSTLRLVAAILLSARGSSSFLNKTFPPGDPTNLPFVQCAANFRPPRTSVIIPVESAQRRKDITRK